VAEWAGWALVMAAIRAPEAEAGAGAGGAGEALRGAQGGARAYARAHARAAEALGGLAGAVAGLGCAPRRGGAAGRPGPGLAGALKGLGEDVRAHVLGVRGRPAQRWRFSPEGGEENPGRVAVTALEDLLAAEEEAERALVDLQVNASRLKALALEFPVLEAGPSSATGSAEENTGRAEDTAWKQAEAAREAVLLTSLVVEMLGRDNEGLRAVVGDCCRRDALAAPLDTYSVLLELQPFIDERVLDLFQRLTL